jgi:hypothetical protein
MARSWKPITLTFPAAPTPAADSRPAEPDRTLETFVRDHPHCRQIATPSLCLYARPVCQVRELPAFLDGSSQTMPFSDRPDADRSPLHWGQMKLFISELDFLTSIVPHTRGLTVLYAGAAPGDHISFLAGLFPGAHFVLYDPAPFCKTLCEHPPSNVEVHHSAFFDDGIAARYAASSKDLAFICDIRTGKDETHVRTDMATQERWVRIMGPAVSLLKFRLPWGDGTSSYLDGNILLQAYAPLTSTETRLVVTASGAAAPPRTYDHGWYERACAFHNTVGRARAYAHGVTGVPGLDGCHDCATLARVAREYLEGKGCTSTPGAVRDFINTVVREIGAGRTLATPYAVSSTRRGAGPRPGTGRAGRS